MGNVPLTLPAPGGDSGSWGDKLNAALTAIRGDYLSQADAAAEYLTPAAGDGRYVQPTPASAEALAGSRNALGLYWAAWAARHTARVNIACIGDSITEGQGATLLARRWVGRLADVLRTRGGLPAGGVGYIGGHITGETTIADYPLISVTGAPTIAGGFGPKRAAPTLDAAGQELTFTVTGTAVDVMWVQNNAGGTFSVAIDANPATNVDTSGAGLVDGHTTRVSLGSAGSHTVHIAWVSGSSIVDGIVVYDGDETAGVGVHDCGHYGWTTGNWTNQPGATFWPAAVQALRPACVVIELMANDVSSGIDAATSQTNLATLIGQVRSAQAAPLPPIVLLVYPARGAYKAAWAAYVAAAYAVAAADPTVLVCDLSVRMPAVDDAAGWNVYADTVHPTDTGHGMIADVLADFLTPR